MNRWMRARTPRILIYKIFWDESKLLQVYALQELRNLAMCKDLVLLARV